MPERPHLHQRLSYRVSRLARIMQARVEAVLAPEGLTRMMWLVLTGLGEDGVTTPSDLADYIGITRPATSRLLARMEGAGFVVRSGSAADGRSVSVALTDRGREVLARLRPQVDAVLARFTAKLDPAALAVLIDRLGRLAEAEDIDLQSL
jgi:DNA-binding MarR family transcriptional regulator